MTTYGLTKSNVIQQRIDAAISTSRRNAQDVGRDLRSNPATTESAQDTLNSSWRAELPDPATRANGREAVTRTPCRPTCAQRVIDEHDSAVQIANVADELNIVVGWAVPGGGSYFEFSNLDEAEATLSSVRLSLVFAALISTLLGCAPRHLRRASCRQARGDRGASRLVHRRRSTRHAARINATTPTCGSSPTRSTTWPRRCSSASNATPASHRTSATSCDPR